MLPLERLRLRGISVDVASQLARQVGDERKDATGNDFAFNAGEPDFDLTKLGRVGGCEVQVQVPMIGKEVLHQLGFMRRQVIQNDVDLLFGRATGNDFG